MYQKLQQLNHIDFQEADIQYLPSHRCPRCRALPRTTRSGDWIKPYQDWFGTALSYWLDHIGYVQFQCDCRHHRQFSGSLRVARLGDAILPLHFDDGTIARKIGVETAIVNADRVRQAVTFLAKHGDPTRTAGSDWLAHTLNALAAGEISPDMARGELNRWVEGRIALALNKERVDPRVLDPVDLAG
jgi:hypothetical protein